MKAKTKFAIGAGIIVLAVSALGFLGAKQTQTYNYSVDEVATLSSTALHQRMRVGGNVAAGSIKHMPGRIDFVLTWQGKTMPVSYVGRDPLPDTFKDGAQALVDGHAMPDGRFVAEQVQAKCASKYEAGPDGSTTSAPASTSGGNG